MPLVKGGISYPNETLEVATKRMLVTIFSGVNLLIISPFISRNITKVYEGEIEKEAFVKRIAILLFIFALCLIFENGYMKDTQKGIIEIYQKVN